MTKEQKTEVARLVFQLATLAMLSFMMLHRACAQGNWRILVERDTMAIGPLNDVRKWAGLRMAKNDMARQCAWELAQRGKELSSLYAERDACWDTVNEAKKVMDAMRETQESLIARNDKLARKVKRRQPWIWMAVGAGGVLLIQNQMR